MDDEDALLDELLAQDDDDYDDDYYDDDYYDDEEYDDDYYDDDYYDDDFEDDMEEEEEIESVSDWWVDDDQNAEWVVTDKAMDTYDDKWTDDAEWDSVSKRIQTKSGHLMTRKCLSMWGKRLCLCQFLDWIDGRKYKCLPRAPDRRIGYAAQQFIDDDEYDEYDEYDDYEDQEDEGEWQDDFEDYGDEFDDEYDEDFTGML